MSIHSFLRCFWIPSMLGTVPRPGDTQAGGRVFQLRKQPCRSTELRDRCLGRSQKATSLTLTIHIPVSPGPVRSAACPSVGSIHSSASLQPPRVCRFPNWPSLLPPCPFSGLCSLYNQWGCRIPSAWWADLPHLLSSPTPVVHCRW